MHIRLIVSFFLLFNSLINYAETGKQIFNKAKKASDWNLKVSLYIQAGETFITENKYNSAIKSFERAEKEIKKNGNIFNDESLKLKFANCLIKVGKENEAIEKILEAKEIAFNKSDEDKLIEIYQLLINIYKKRNDSVKAEEYSNLKESLESGLLSEDLKKQLNKKNRLLNSKEKEINNQEKLIENINSEKDVMSEEIDELDTKLEKTEKDLNKKEALLKFANLENENKNLKIERQQSELQTERTIIIGFVIIFMLLIILALITFYSFDKIKKNTLIITKQKEKITASITYAQRIQEAAMPQLDYIKSHFPQSFVLFKPKEIVSGDFFWMYKNPLKENSFFIAAVDCTGHGVPGAFMSMIGINQLNKIISQKNDDVGEILEELNVSIIKALRQEETDNQDGMDMSLCRVDIDDKKIYFAGARNPLVYIQNNEMYTVKATRRGIGGVIKTNRKIELPKFQTTCIDASNVDAFYIFSDGLPDQIGSESGKKITTKRFSNKLLDIHSTSFESQKEELWNYFNNWRGTEEIFDDVLVIGFKI